MEHTNFSIIIPSYNAASFLHDTLKSVLNQTYIFYEVILVDDGSTDDSPTLCSYYEEKYENIRLITIPHSGAGAARNAGLRFAHGDFVLFLDADDYWRDPDLLKKIDHQIRHRKTDIVMFQMIQVSEDGTLLLNTRKPQLPNCKTPFLVKEIFPVLVRDGQVLASACNKCVRRSLLTHHNITFLEGTTGEDIDWVLQVFSQIKTISFLNEEAYAYRQHKVGKRASNSSEGPHNLAVIIRYWADLLKTETVPNKKAVAGMVAFEYGIYMGYSHLVSRQERKQMKQYRYLLQYGLDRKTKMIGRFYKTFGYHLTCLAVRCYLWFRQMRR